MTTYHVLEPDQFLSVGQLRAMTEFPTVEDRTAAQLGLYVRRAHIALGDWLPFDDRRQPERFASEMEVAVFMVAESMALANPTRAAAAAGITSETIGKYSYSRAPGGGNTGKGVAGDLVPDEALAILARWSQADDDSVSVATTQVFPEAALVTATGELRRFGLGDDTVLDQGDAWGSPWGPGGVRG